jgi:hypothetical protein
MPDVRRHPTIAPILALVLVTMLGNSGIACACALLALDAPGETHHGMSHAPLAADAGEHDDCGSACGNQSATAVNSKAPIAADHQPEKPAAPAAHHDSTVQVIASGLPGRWWYEEQRLPLSTPVSRSDTMLD